jgi:hypothetical protein
MVVATVVSTIIAGVPRAVIPIVAWNEEQVGVKEKAFPEIKLALFPALVAGEDVESLVAANGGITAHGLVVDGNSAVCAAASDQVAQNVGYIGLYIAEAVSGTHDLPAFVLGGNSRVKERDTQAKHKKQN